MSTSLEFSQKHPFKYKLFTEQGYNNKPYFLASPLQQSTYFHSRVVGTI